MTKAACGTSTSTSFVWNIAEGLPLLLSDGTNNYVYGPGGIPLQQIPVQGISRVATGSATDAPAGGPGSLTANFSAPAAANDQIIVAVDEAQGMTASIQGGGYTSVGSFTAPSGNNKTEVFRRTATGGESSVRVNFALGTPPNLHVKAIAVIVYRNVDPANPIDVQSSGSAGSGSTSVTAPSVTTTKAGDQLLMVESALNNTLAATWTPPAGMTNRVSAGGSFVSLALADKTLGAAGATGDQTATVSQPGSLVGVLLALKPVPPPVLYFHQDQLGSTRVLTNGAGSIVATYTFDAYGNTTAKTGTATTPLQFAGQYTDAETGLQYLRARYYDPSTGGFLTRDPLTDTTGQPYLYAGANPVNATDPTGLLCGGPIFCPVVRHWRGVAQGVVTGVGVVAGAVCVAATAGICAGAIGTVVGVTGIGASLGAATYGLSGGEHTLGGYLRAAGIGGTAGLLSAGCALSAAAAAGICGTFWGAILTNSAIGLGAGLYDYATNTACRTLEGYFQAGAFGLLGGIPFEAGMLFPELFGAGGTP